MGHDPCDKHASKYVPTTSFFILPSTVRARLCSTRAFLTTFFMFFLFAVFDGSGFTQTLCGGQWPRVFTSNTPEIGIYGRLGCCPAGEYMVNPHLNPFSVASSCSTCPSGFIERSAVPNDDTTCFCPAGLYISNDASTSTCLPMTQQTCPIGQGFKSATATDQTNNAGSTENDGICTMCAPGQYKSTVSPSSCSVCPPGTYQDNIGSSSCIKCPKGTYLKLAGTAIFHDSLDDCQECNVQTFNPFEGHDQDCYMCLTAIIKGSVQCDGCDPGTCLLLVVAEDDGFIVVVKVV